MRLKRTYSGPSGLMSECTRPQAFVAFENASDCFVNPGQKMPMYKIIDTIASVCRYAC